MRYGPVTQRKVAPAPELATDPSALSANFSQMFVRARAEFLNALPIPGALIGQRNGEIVLVDSNAAFRDLDAGSAPLLSDSGLAARMLAFMESHDACAEHGWHDGDPITGRAYTVRMGRVRLILTEADACLITLLDRTAERAAEKSLRLEMFNDSLTGLPNRAGFAERLEQVLTEIAPRSMAVLIIDLARFSRINESIGTVAGDELLITVARRLLSTVRAGDVLGRTGGNEFGIFAKVTGGAEEALALADRVAQVLTDPCRLSDLEIRVDCSIGCAVLEPGCDADELVRRAQFALKRAKATGEPEIYQPKAFDRARRHFTIETSLRRAIEAERLTLAFQPVIDLATGIVSSFEALARWTEDGQEVSPASFIPVAEESGLIVPLGRWVMDAALERLGAWDRAAGGRAPGARVAVNLSAIQIARDDVPRFTQSSLTAHRIAPERLTLELTESAIVADPDRAARAMERIRAIGASIALDDFGTGYSNLAYLQKLPIDVLKIDQSFVIGMLGDRDKVAIVRAILSLAEALGLKTTAEGVETIELAQTLAALGCTSGQGYYYAPPLDPDAAFDFWSRSTAAAT